ncbi:MAG: isochorismatase family protein [Halobacteriales archaeon]|nr:isochorismatase family protein [Halobacteriales archaeon]
MGAARTNPERRTRNATRSSLLAAWRAADRPIVHVQHASTDPDSPLRPDRPGFAIKPAVAPEGDEPVVRTSVNSAFIGTELEARLREDGIDAVVVTGLTTDHCVSTTARMAANLGFETAVVADDPRRRRHRLVRRARRGARRSPARRRRAEHRRRPLRRERAHHDDRRGRHGRNSSTAVRVRGGSVRRRSCEADRPGCVLSRAELAAAVPAVAVPADGELVELA